jgi:thioredoxin 1
MGMDISNKHRVADQNIEEAAMIMKLIEQDFDVEVLEAASPVFACFTTSHCRACFALCLIVEDLAREYSRKMKFVMIDTEQEPQLAERYNILPLPTVLVFQHGKPQKKLLGFQSKSYLISTLEELISNNSLTD